MTIQNKNSIDTFEKFLNFGENEDEKTYAEIARLEKQLARDQETERNKRLAKQLNKLNDQQSNAEASIIKSVEPPVAPKQQV